MFKVEKSLVLDFLFVVFRFLFLRKSATSNSKVCVQTHIYDDSKFSI